MADTVSAEISNSIHWTVKLEEYFASTGEKAHCLSWVHKKSEELYSTRKTFIDLPVIVGSGVIAFLNAGSSSMFDDPKISSVALGIGSLVVGILNTMGTYFGWARRAEGHRISAIHYAKLYRFISIEMSLPRDERMSPHDLLKLVKDQYDRLAEISPMVPATIIETFRKNFDKYTDISKPEEANGLEKISVFRPSDEEEMIGSLKRNISSPVDSANSTPFVIANPMNTASKFASNAAAAVSSSAIAAAAKLSLKQAEKYVPSLQVLDSIEKSIKIPTVPSGVATPDVPNEKESSEKVVHEKEAPVRSDLEEQKE